MAIATRWRMPPESWWGYCRSRCSGAGNADRRQQLGAAPRRRRRVHAEMRLQRLDDLGADGEHGIERGHRVLEDHGELGPAQLAQFLRRQAGEVAAGEHHPAAEPGALGQQLQDGARQHGLAAARFAHDAQRAAGRQAEIDIVDRPQRRRAASAGRPTRPRPTAAVAVTAPPGRGSVSARSVSPTMLKDSTVRNMKPRRQEGEPRRDVEALAALADHAAPARRRRRHAEAQEGQRALDDDGDGDAQQEEGEQRQRHVGQQLADQDAGMRGAERARGGDELALAQSDRVTARDTRVKAGMPSTPITRVMFSTDWPR